MSISNSSMLPFGWTSETLLGSHASKPFNLDIANVFFRMGYVESWGRGIKKIHDATKAIGAKEPVYYIHGDDMMVKFKALFSETLDEILDGTMDGTMEERILTLLKVNPRITTTEMIEALSKSRRSVQRGLENLKNLIL